jgi:hypothetical protein
MFDLYEEFQKLTKAVDEPQVDYALCGGLAMAVYDRPRATIDIDLLIVSESLDVVMEIAKQTGRVLSLDLLLVTPEIRPVWESRVEADWEGGKLSVVSPDGLISLKTMRGSAQELADIQALKEDIDDATN